LKTASFGDLDGGAMAEHFIQDVVLVPKDAARAGIAEATSVPEDAALNKQAAPPVVDQQQSVPEKPVFDPQQWRRVRVNQERIPIEEATSVPEDAALTSGSGVGEATAVPEDAALTSGRGVETQAPPVEVDQQQLQWRSYLSTRLLRLTEPSLGTKALANKLREPQPDLAAGRQECYEAERQLRGDACWKTSSSASDLLTERSHLRRKEWRKEHMRNEPGFHGERAAKESGERAAKESSTSKEGAENGSTSKGSAGDGSSQPTVIPLSAAGDALPDCFQSLRCSQPAASDAASEVCKSEVSYFTDRWMPGGLLDEDGASRSALNPEAGSFVPRGYVPQGYMPQVAEDEPLATPPLDEVLQTVLIRMGITGPPEKPSPPRSEKPSGKHFFSVRGENGYFLRGEDDAEPKTCHKCGGPCTRVTGTLKTTNNTEIPGLRVCQDEECGLLQNRHKTERICADCGKAFNLNDVASFSRHACLRAAVLAFKGDQGAKALRQRAKTVPPEGPTPYPPRTATGPSQFPAGPGRTQFPAGPGREWMSMSGRAVKARYSGLMLGLQPDSRGVM